MADVEWVGRHKGPLYEMLKDLRDHSSDDATMFIERCAGGEEGLTARNKLSLDATNPEPIIRIGNSDE